MEELAALLLASSPFIVSASIGLFFARAWQRALVAGTGSAAIFAGYTYFAQRDLAGHFAGSSLSVADPMATAVGAALVTFPIGIGAGLTLHLIASFIRNKEP